MPLIDPNLFLLVVDDMEPGADDARAMPYKVTLPWLRLANARCSTPLCTPNRHTLYRGDRSDHHLQVENALVQPIDLTDNFGAWHALAGRDTCLVGKLFNGFAWGDFATHDPGWGRLFATGDHAYTGWTAYRQDGTPVVGGAEYATDRYRDEALAFLADAATDAPWTLVVATGAPHGPPEVAARHVGLDCGGATAADDPPAWNAQMANAIPNMVLSSLTGGGGDSERNQIRAQRADCRRALRAVDELLEDVLAAITARGELGNTVVVFVNDNGQSMGRHRLDVGTTAGTDSGKRRPYTWCLDAQLSMLYPGQAARTIPELVTTADLAPTFAAMAGVEPDFAFDGLDLTPLLEGTATTWRSALETCYRSDNHPDISPWDSVEWRTRNGRHHWRWNEYEDGQRELFHLRDDPHELVNVAADPANADTVTFLTRKLRRLRARSQGQRAAA